MSFAELSAAHSPSTATFAPTATATAALADSDTFGFPDAATTTIGNCAGAFRTNFVKVKYLDRSRPTAIGLGVVLGVVLFANLLALIWLKLVYLPHVEKRTQERIDAAVSDALLAHGPPPPRPGLPDTVGLGLILSDTDSYAMRRSESFRCPNSDTSSDTYLGSEEEKGCDGTTSSLCSCASCESSDERAIPVSRNRLYLSPIS